VMLRCSIIRLLCGQFRKAAFISTLTIERVQKLNVQEASRTLQQLLNMYTTMLKLLESTISRFVHQVSVEEAGSVWVRAIS